MALPFMGNHEHTLDDKGRVIIPSKFREKVDPETDGYGFVVTLAPEECLLLYTPAEWGRICQQMQRIPKGSREYREFQRQWYGRAEEARLDKQGRILLPERLRHLVHIDREIVIAGCFDRLEVWDKSAWHAREAAGRAMLGDQFEMFLGQSEFEPPSRP